MKKMQHSFCLGELLDALSNCKDSAVGPGDIHYQMLKHLPLETLNTLLSIVNDVWITGNCPCSWRQSYVVSVPKPGKDTTNHTNYHPIAFTSCVCKIFECMINNRLVWYLRRNKIITPAQCGFCKGRSTNDQLVRFECFVTEAFIHKQHATGVVSDLEKAYNMEVWHFKRFT